MSKETWIVEPHDSLIVRDGRPFNATAGSRAKSLDFPVPSTLIGSVRTQIGLANGGNWDGFDEKLIEQILQIEMSGALLAEIKDGGLLEFFAPAPADALLVKLEKEDENDAVKNNLFPLVPLKKDYLSNLPNDLHLLGIKEEVKGKPSSEVRFWKWKRFEKWLIEAKTTKVKNEDLGIGGLITDERTHVKIDYEKKANVKGDLFQTRGLEFTTKDDRRRLVLALQLSNSEGLKEGLFPLGGERRIVRWKKEDAEFPSCPREVIDGIKKSKACRLILLTPAYFESGFLSKKINAEIKAVAVNRSQVISGWDFKKRRPKPTRRLTPAGTVYFLKNIIDVEKFIEEIWLKNIGDCKQTKRDGFGLTVLGNWDGNTQHEIER